MFRNRAHAAQLLIEKLGQYRGQRPLVLAIPRGAVPIAALISKALEGDLDVVLVHKLGAPGDPEFAIGAVSEDGTVHLSERAHSMGIARQYLKAEIQSQLESLRARRQQYTPVRLPLDPAGRVVLVVDDGIATGETMAAALAAVRAHQPSTLVGVTPVAAPEALRRIQALADDVICLEAPTFFYAVGQFYRDFTQVSDQDVIEALSRKLNGAFRGP